MTPIVSSGVPVDDESNGAILYESHNLTLKAGTGIATYARALARAAKRLGYSADALFGVQRMAGRHGRLNEILAFDAISEAGEPPFLERALNTVLAPVAALGGLSPIRLPRTGMVVGSMADVLQPYRDVLVTPRLIDVCAAHFSIYRRMVTVRPPQRPSIFHATHPVPIKVNGCPNIYTIHDLIPLRLPHTTLENKKYFYRLLMKIAAKADHIVTVSEHSKQDIMRFLGVEERRVTNTYQAVDIPGWLLARSNNDVARDLNQLFNLDFGDYFLFYGAIEPKKNIARMIDAYAASGTKLPLIIAGGSGWQNRIDLRKIRDERFISFKVKGDIVTRQRQVRWLNYVPQDQLVSLIRGARGVLFPSIYEGFGLPVIEAMTLGTPVVTSNSSSLPEVAGDAALLVDPHSTDSISQAIAALDSDRSLGDELSVRGRSQARKFSSAAYDTRLHLLYDSILH
jgi:glycosyltransferase involved in cell wall biosynthesis